MSKKNGVILVPVKRVQERLRRMGYEWILSKPVEQDRPGNFMVYRHCDITEAVVLLDSEHEVGDRHAAQGQGPYFDEGYAKFVLDMAASLIRPTSDGDDGDDDDPPTDMGNATQVKPH